MLQKGFKKHSFEHPFLNNDSANRVIVAKKYIKHMRVPIMQNAYTTQHTIRPQP